MHIGVLCGGLSEEREVSLRTGEAIYQGLLAKGYKVTKYDVNRDFLYNLKKGEFDLAFIALHGKYGEDGTIQGYLELLDIPYTGSGVLASSIAMNKIMTKKLLSLETIPTPKFATLKKADIREDNLGAEVDRILNTIPLPVVVKAPTQGSSIGVYFVNAKEELAPAIKEAFQYDEEILIEEMLKGKELTVSILGNNEPLALPAIEIISNTGVYDYESKYTVGLSEHLIPAGISHEQEDLIKRYALAAYKAVGCRGLARVDFMLKENTEPMVLEINTIPGMTNTSLFPDAAKAAGIEFPELVDKLVKLALEK
jgi:D-alanine-D-alanine ligase